MRNQLTLFDFALYITVSKNFGKKLIPKESNQLEVSNMFGWNPIYLKKGKDEEEKQQEQNIFIVVNIFCSSSRIYAFLFEP